MRIPLTDTIELFVSKNRQFPTLPCCNVLFINDEVQALIDTGAERNSQVGRKADNPVVSTASSTRICILII